MCSAHCPCIVQSTTTYVTMYLCTKCGSKDCNMIATLIGKRLKRVNRLEAFQVEKDWLYCWWTNSRRQWLRKRFSSCYKKKFAATNGGSWRQAPKPAPQLLEKMFLRPPAAPNDVLHNESAVNLSSDVGNFSGNFHGSMRRAGQLQSINQCLPATRILIRCHSLSSQSIPLRYLKKG